MKASPRNTILLGDAIERLRSLPSACIDAVVTSPPYFSLRDFGSPQQIGLEPTIEQWVKRLVEVFGELARVIKPQGSVWLNLGDTYSHHAATGVAAKSLALAPERLLLALVAQGWLVRSKLIWHKPNAVPRYATDRLNPTYDVVFLLVRQPRYYFALDLIREPLGEGWVGKMPPDVWSIPSRAGYGGHSAAFPPELVRRPILASCPERVCIVCNRGWEPVSETVRVGRPQRSQRRLHQLYYPTHYEVKRRVTGLRACDCAAPTVPGLVLDPFSGSGTVGVVAQQLQRDFLGIELNRRYVQMSQQRLGWSSPRMLKTAA